MAESSLHAALKRALQLPGDRLEVPVAGFLIDLVRGDPFSPPAEHLLIEIQTRQFWHMRPKLDALLTHHRLLLVHPVVAARQIVYQDAHGAPLGPPRRSPRHDRPERLFRELLRFPALVNHPHFALEILLIHEEERRLDDGRGSWRRGGVSIVDRRLLAVIDRLPLPNRDAYRRFLPADLPRPFTTAEFSAAARLPARLGQQTIYCLRGMGLLQSVGTRGRSILYEEIPA